MKGLEPSTSGLEDRRSIQTELHGHVHFILHNNILSTLDRSPKKWKEYFQDPLLLI